MYGDDLSLINIGLHFLVKGNGSTNYAVNTKGGVGLYVDEDFGPMTTGTTMLDRSIISIGVPAFDKSDKDTTITKDMYDKLVELCVDICRRNNIPTLVYNTDSSTLVTYVDDIEMNHHRSYLKDVTKTLVEDVNNMLLNYSTSIIKVPEAEIITPATNEFKIKVLIDTEIKDGPGDSYTTSTIIRDHAVYTISETYNNWGKLKSGLGWINLDNTVRIDN